MVTPEVCGGIYAQYLGDRIEQELVDGRARELEGILSTIKVCRTLGQITPGEVILLRDRIIFFRPQSEERLKKELGL